MMYNSENGKMDDMGIEEEAIPKRSKVFIL